MKKYIIALLILIAVGCAVLFLFKSEGSKVSFDRSENVSAADVQNVLDVENVQNVQDVQNDDRLEQVEQAKRLNEQSDRTTRTSDSDSTSTTSVAIKQKLVSFGYQVASNRKIDTIIIHSSYDAIGKEPYDVDGLIKEYKQYEVAAHYLIDRKGNIYQLVADKNIAYHAGVSKVPDGRTNVNAFSLGIELMNKEYETYSKEQYESLNSLIKSLKGKYEIKYVLGHKDVAPGRKTDPWNIEWGKVPGYSK